MRPGHASGQFFSFVARSRRYVSCVSQTAEMTGAGDEVSYSIPLERTPRLPSDHRLKKSAAKAGESRFAARSSEHGDLFATWPGNSKGYARSYNLAKTVSYGSMRAGWGVT